MNKIANRKVKKLPISRVVVVDPKKLTTEDKNTLAPILMSIHDELYHMTGTEEFIYSLLNPEDEFASLILLYGENANIIGFSYHYVITFNEQKKPYAVMRTGAFVNLKYAGGKCLVRLLSQSILAFKLRNPRIPLYVCMMTVSPAAYALVNNFFSRIYPSITMASCNIVNQLREQMIEYCGYKTVSNYPWLVEFPSYPVSPAKLNKSKRLNQDPAVNFYKQMNPFGEGGYAVMLIVPLSVENILTLAGQIMRNALRKMILVSKMGYAFSAR